MYAGLYPLRETCLGSPGQNVKIFTPKARGLRPLGSGSRGPLWTPLARTLFVIGAIPVKAFFNSLRFLRSVLSDLPLYLPLGPLGTWLLVMS